jgi:AcrR family transcriptional regulator
MAQTPRLPREVRRAQLISAAAATFRDRGFDKTSMEEIAQAAGVSRLIVYRNFESKEDLYRQVLRQLLADLAAAFQGLSFEEVRERGAANMIMPVARSHADAFRLLWRDAWHQPPFEDLAIEFRTYVTTFAKAILSNYIEDPVLLDWAARTAGAHLVEGICNWLDDGDPARDDEIARTMTAGIRALATSWVGSATR